MLTLIIGNKNYSSWSLRPWLAMTQLGIEFTEIRIPLYTDTASELLHEYSPAGKVPILLDGELTVWDSLAILEHLMESFPDLAWLPQAPTARAIARSICAEMHAGFGALRTALPMNLRASKSISTVQPEVQREIDRITKIWRDCRQEFGTGGDLLFGQFSLADAMYAPVVSRFSTYGIALDPICQHYAEAIWALPAMQSWAAAAKLETESIAMYEQ